VIESFQAFNLNPNILKSLQILKYVIPTPVQREVIPVLLDKTDLIIKSKTGSGKTAAFAIPIIEHIIWDQKEPQVLVLTPTRELALQVKDDMFHIGRFSRIKVEAIYGKSSFENQMKQLNQRTHIIVSTPGRLLDHIDKKTVDLSRITTLVIDEADELLRMGFIEDVQRIIHMLPMPRLTVLLSATLPNDIDILSKRYMKTPRFIEIEDTSMDKTLEEYYYDVEEASKIRLLEDVIHSSNPESMIVFCNTKQKVDDVYQSLSNKGYSVYPLHGDMEQKDRMKVMGDFKHGVFRYLIATDVASRGLDIDAVALIINYDIPQSNEHYVHRIGRSARAGKRGKAITFVSSKEKHSLERIQAFTQRPIVALNVDALEDVVNTIASSKHSTKHPIQLKMDKGYAFHEEIMKLHINAGKKTKMRASDILGTLCAIEGIQPHDIGVITLLDISTFVEILNRKGDIVYHTLQTMPIKGRLRVVSKANKSTYEQYYEAHKDHQT